MEVRVLGQSEGGSQACIVELRDEDGKQARIYNAGDETWQCGFCENQLRGGVRISGAMEICESCVRALAHAPSEELLEQWRTRFGAGLAMADRSVEGLGDLLSIYPPWRLFARRRLRREVLGVRRNLRDHTEYLGEPDGRESIAEMIDGMSELVAIIDRYFRAPKTEPVYGDFPRSLRPPEQAILELLVSANVPGAEALRIQAQSVSATTYCGCGCPSIYLEVDRERARQAVDARRPAATTNNDPDDPADTLWLSLWTEDGWLSYLEISWISDKPPLGFPSPDGFLPPYAGGSERFT